MCQHRYKEEETEYLNKAKAEFFQRISPKCCYAKIYAEYVKIFLDKEKVNVYNTKSMRKERLRYYEDKYIGNLI